MEIKICSNSECRKELPATIEFFHRQKGRKYGLRSWCKECRNRYSRKVYLDNREQKLAQNRRWYEENRDERLEQQKEYAKTEDGRKVGRKARKKRYRKYKLSECISVRIWQSLRGNKRGRHWETLVPYVLDDLKQHLESLFQSGMTWENYGKYGWHVDHKIPISAFNITSYECEEFQECWALENLQPLWAEENLRKAAKIDYR